MTASDNNVVPMGLSAETLLLSLRALSRHMRRTIVNHFEWQLLEN